jgi:hypothetical protein
VARDGRLADAELALDDARNLAGRVIAAREKLDEATPNRVTEDVERVHPSIV